MGYSGNGKREKGGKQSELDWIGLDVLCIYEYEFIQIDAPTNNL